MVNIVLVSGSVRADSANSAVLRAAAAHLVEAGADAPPASVATASINEVPLYSEDVEEAGWPDPVQALRDVVSDADAVIISTPEYNGSMPGGLKNALDWLSRPYGAGVLQGKLVATISASPSPHGAKWAQDHLRHVLDICSARLINAEEVTVPQVFESLDASGDVVDAEVLAAIGSLADEVTAACRAAGAAPSVP